jgi:DNA repair exonuclease SbcCD ATPase subunit
MPEPREEAAGAETVLAAKSEEPAKSEESPRPSTDAPAALHPAPLASPLTTPLVSDQPISAPIAMSIPLIVTPQASSPRQSLDSDPSRPSVDGSALPEEESTTRDPDVLFTELSALQEAHEETVRSHRDELNSHLERIDALQSKLAYLSQQLASSAKASASDAETTPADKKLADRDAQIAALMEEGQRLSKTEMKHLTTVKQLRARAQEHNKELTTLKQRLSKAEKSISDQSDRAKRAEAGEKAAQEKLKVVGKLEKDFEHIRAEREEAALTIVELRRQLNDALSRAESAEKRAQTGALEAEKRTTASLKEDTENLRIEKKLAEDRARRELQASKDEAKNQQEKGKVTELELRGEVAVCSFPS